MTNTKPAIDLVLKRDEILGKRSYSLTRVIDKRVEASNFSTAAEAFGWVAKWNATDGAQQMRIVSEPKTVQFGVGVRYDDPSRAIVLLYRGIGKKPKEVPAEVAEAAPELLASLKAAVADLEEFANRPDEEGRVVAPDSVIRIRIRLFKRAIESAEVL